MIWYIIEYAEKVTQSDSKPSKEKTHENVESVTSDSNALSISESEEMNQNANTLAKVGVSVAKIVTPMEEKSSSQQEAKMPETSNSVHSNIKLLFVSP